MKVNRANLDVKRLRTGDKIFFDKIIEDYRSAYTQTTK